MTISVLKQKNCLIAAIQTAATDQDLLTLRDCLLEEVGHHRSTGVILDVTGLDVMDSFAVRTFQELAHIIQLRGANTLVVGIQPDVALSMVKQGLELDGIGTALDVEQGLDYFDARQASSER